MNLRTRGTGRWGWQGVAGGQIPKRLRKSSRCAQNTKWPLSTSHSLSPTFLPLGLHCLKRRGLISALWMKWAIKSEFRQAAQLARGLLWCFSLHFTQHLQEELQLFIKNLWLLFLRICLEIESEWVLTLKNSSRGNHEKTNPCFRGCSVTHCG